MREIFGTYTPDQKLADLHIHSNRSDGHLGPLQIVELAAEIGILNTIAITDHDTVQPAAEAKEYGLKMSYPLDVVVGAEISTARGHLLGLYLEHDIPSQKSAAWTIKEIHRQGGLAIAAHPLFKRVRSFTEDTLIELMANPDPEIFLDGFELYNAGVNNYSDTANAEAKEIYLKYEGQLGAAIGSTDMHYFIIGRGLTGYKNELYEAIKSSQTTVLYPEKEEIDRITELVIDLFPEDVKRLSSRLEVYKRRRERKTSQRTHLQKL